jgi:hypothetical protein
MTPKQHAEQQEQLAPEADQEKRAREIADATRRYVTALNTGGVASALALASALAPNGVEPRWVVGPVFWFTVGLLITGSSYFLAKHKALKRRNAIREAMSEPDFTHYLLRNFTWDFSSLVAFGVGAILGLWGLACMDLPEVLPRP